MSDKLAAVIGFASLTSIFAIGIYSLITGQQ